MTAKSFVGVTRLTVNTQISENLHINAVRYPTQGNQSESVCSDKPNLSAGHLFAIRDSTELLVLWLVSTYVIFAVKSPSCSNYVTTGGGISVSYL